MAAGCKCCRSGSGSKPDEPSRAVNGTTARRAKQEPSTSQASAQHPSQGPASDPDLVEEVPLMAGPELASHDRLPAMSSRSDVLGLADHAHQQPGFNETHGIGHNAVGKPEGNKPSGVIAGNIQHWEGSNAAAISTHDTDLNEQNDRESDVLDDLSMGRDDVDDLSDIDLQDALGIDV